VVKDLDDKFWLSIDQGLNWTPISLDDEGIILLEDPYLDSQVFFFFEKNFLLLFCAMILEKRIWDIEQIYIGINWKIKIN